MSADVDFAEDDQDDEVQFVTMSVDNNKGYSADQVESTMTLRDMLAAIEEAIDEFGEDAIVVTKDTGNRYGANWGRLDQWGDLFTPVGGDRDEDERD